MSQDIGMTPNPRSGFGVSASAGWASCAARRAGWLSGGQVGSRVSWRSSSPVAVDDPDVQVLDEQQDVCSGVGSPDADAVEPPGVAEGHVPGGADTVVADAVVGTGVAVARDGVGPADMLAGEL